VDARHTAGHDESESYAAGMTRALLASMAVQLDIVVKSPLWKSERGVESLLRRAIAAAAARARLGEAELAIVLTDDAAIRKLNRGWRRRDRPTNVLSFPAPPHPAGARPRLLGDVVIAYETTAREAAAEGKPFKNHVSHLAVHGFLHLLGYDHGSAEEAEEMEGLERAILITLGIPDPFAS
jgi:probable rRNA maturation factor